MMQTSLQIIYMIYETIMLLKSWRDFRNQVIRIAISLISVTINR